MPRDFSLRRRKRWGSAPDPAGAAAPDPLDKGDDHLQDLEQDDLALGNDNERMVVANLWSYWAHLSIYRFAVAFCRGRTVLDVGTGVGYGAAYLADHEAQVHAVDGDPASVEHANRKYAGKSATYAVADLNQKLACEDRSFDVVFSSNVFEHIANVDELAAECARIVKQDGVVIIAVPPITVAWIAQDDMRNVHHVHHLPPAAWYAKLSRFFGKIECHGHQGTGRWGESEVQASEISRWVDQTTIRETDFEFPAVPIEQLNTWQCITALFVCREPKLVVGPETLEEREPRDWNMGALAAGLIAEERTKTSDVQNRLSNAQRTIDAVSTEIDLLNAQTDRLEKNLSDQSAEIVNLQSELTTYRTLHNEMINSTTWRLTQPLRQLITSLRSATAGPSQHS